MTPRCSFLVTPSLVKGDFSLILPLPPFRNIIFDMKYHFQQRQSTIRLVMVSLLAFGQQHYIPPKKQVDVF